MLADRLPALISSYLQYIQIREKAVKSGSINLTGADWINSTTVLLLSVLKSKLNCEVKSDGKSRAKQYVNVMIQDPMWWKNDAEVKHASGNSYIPLSQLPVDVKEFKNLLDKTDELMESYNSVGGKNAFSFVKGELSDNIYEHSKFEAAFMLGQAYPRKKYIELSFVDDGISIPRNFEEHGIAFDGDWKAIKMAVGGTSTKDPNERGTGLGGSLKIYCIGVGAEAMITSRNGIYYQNGPNVDVYELPDTTRLDGTLVSIRIPMTKKAIDIYRYL